MVEDFIMRGEDYSIFRIVREDLIDFVENNSELSEVVSSAKRHARREGCLDLEGFVSDVKLYLAYHFFSTYQGDLETFRERIDPNIAGEVIYNDVYFFRKGKF